MQQRADTVGASFEATRARIPHAIFATTLRDLYAAAQVYRSVGKTVRQLQLVRLRAQRQKQQQQQQQQPHDATDLASLPDEIFKLILEHLVEDAFSAVLSEWPLAPHCMCEISYLLEDLPGGDDEDFQAWVSKYSMSCECRPRLRGTSWSDGGDSDDPVIRHTGGCSLVDKFCASEEGQDYIRELRLDAFPNCESCVLRYYELWFFAEHPRLRRPSPGELAEAEGMKEVMERFLQDFRLRTVAYHSCDCVDVNAENRFDCEDPPVYLAPAFQHFSDEPSKVIARSTEAFPFGGPSSIDKLSRLLGPYFPPLEERSGGQWCQVEAVETTDSSGAPEETSASDTDSLEVS